MYVQQPLLHAFMRHIGNHTGTFPLFFWYCFSDPALLFLSVSKCPCTRVSVSLAFGRIMLARANCLFVIQVFLVGANFNSLDNHLSRLFLFFFLKFKYLWLVVFHFNVECKLKPCLDSQSAMGYVIWYVRCALSSVALLKITGLIRKLKLYPSLNTMLFRAFEPSCPCLPTVGIGVKPGRHRIYWGLSFTLQKRARTHPHTRTHTSTHTLNLWSLFLHGQRFSIFHLT